jgi:hypothetical protein
VWAAAPNSAEAVMPTGTPPPRSDPAFDLGGSRGRDAIFEILSASVWGQPSTTSTAVM